jgi:hypothetical protein
VGCAALSIYWFVERPGLNKLVNNWFGLNEEKIEQLCDKEVLAKQEKKLENLKEKINRTSKKLSQLEPFSIKEDQDMPVASKVIVPSIPLPPANKSQEVAIVTRAELLLSKEIRVGTHCYSFHKSLSRDQDKEQSTKYSKSL